MPQVDSRLVNLYQFERNFFVPLIDEFTRNQDTRQRNAEDELPSIATNYWRSFRFSELIAAYFWLDLGIETGFFPYAEAKQVFNGRFGKFFFSVEFVEIFERNAYFFDPLFKTSLTNVRSSRTIFGERGDLDTVDATAMSVAAFRSALTAEICLLRTRLAEVFLLRLNFEPERVLQLLKRHTRALAIQSRYFASDNDDEAIIQGFTGIIEYMERLTALSATILKSQDAPTASGSNLERKLRRITRWRVNRFMSTTDSAIMQVGEFVGARTGFSWDEMQPRLEQLLKSWGFSHEKSIATNS